MSDDNHTFKTYPLLMPLAWCYGLGVRIRNIMFDCGVLKQHTFKTPVVCIGNIAVGGTGKTPHTEYLIRLLNGKHRVAVLSRGYKRKSKGWVLADDKATADSIGDEPYQMKSKFPDIIVAVDEDRCEGIRKLESAGNGKPADVILLDDAFQHRHVKAGLNIMLTDYSRLYTRDFLMPAGRLREHRTGVKRADVVIVTKCPNDLSEEKADEIKASLSLSRNQELFFATLRYGNPYSMEYGTGKEITMSSLKEKECGVLLVTGIANPQQMEKYVGEYVSFKSMHYPDHHRFNANDINRIKEEFESLPGERIIITTEKDASRLKTNFSDNDEILSHIFVLPVEVEFLYSGKKSFDGIVEGYVGK